MKMPPFFIGATVLLWGYEKGLLIPAILLSLLIEAGRFTRTRWQLSKEDYVKISDLTSIILLAAIALILMNYKARELLITLTIWLPLILLPLILAQVYGADEKIIIGTRLGSGKKGGREKKEHHMHRPMDFSFAYAAICLFAAASANSRHDAFFPLFFLLAGWLLLAHRGRAFSPLFFVIILTLGGLLGFYGIKGMEEGYSNLNRAMMHLWMARFQARMADPYKANISFGDISRLKLSGKIIIRLQSSTPPPTLLKEAGYNVFFIDHWFNRDQEFTPTEIDAEDNWILVEESNSQSRDLHIETTFTRKKGLIPFPYGIEEVRGLDITELSRTREGLLRFEEGSNFQSYDLKYMPGKYSNTPPGENNLLIPKYESQTLLQIVDNLELEPLSAREKVNRIEEFFRNNFSYTLTTAGKGDYNTPLANFLLHRRSGHCELFATATTLLLRQAGIPSRYITGYAVAEKALFGQGYVIRSRHAHAWAEAYVNEQWMVLDTTPSIWLDQEESQASLLEPIRDFFSFIRHQWELFRARENKKYNLPLSIAVILLAAFLIFRIYRRLRREKVKQEPVQTRKNFQRPDSPFDLVEEFLNSQGPKRRENETFQRWLARIDAERRIDSAHLLALHNLHLRLRFDPHGIGAKEMGQLESGVEEWLRRSTEAEGKGPEPEPITP